MGNKKALFKDTVATSGQFVGNQSQYYPRKSRDYLHTDNNSLFSRNEVCRHIQGTWTEFDTTRPSWARVDLREWSKYNEVAKFGEKSIKSYRPNTCWSSIKFFHFPLEFFLGVRIKISSNGIHTKHIFVIVRKILFVSRTGILSKIYWITCSFCRKPDKEHWYYIICQSVYRLKESCTLCLILFILGAHSENVVFLFYTSYKT